jgi:molybdate transport system permease protein
MISPEDLNAIWITLRLAVTTTVLLMLIGVPIAWWLARTRSRARIVIEAVVAMPLILPPTVLGFYLLFFLGPNGPLGGLVGDAFVFRFSGLVIASMVYSLPFVVQPLRDSFQTISADVLDAASTLRAAPMDRFMTVVVPLARPGFLTAAVLGFAHTVGEFGVALMIGGSIPGRTRVISIAIYDHVESLSYGQAHVLSAGLVAFSFITLLIVYGVNHRFRAVTP